MVGRREEREGVRWRRPVGVGERPTTTRSGSYVGLFRLIPCERIDQTWAFPLHVYLYKNYNPNHKWEITIIRTLHDSEDQGVMSHNVTYLWQSCHIM
jgi:hypothetical protein